MEYKRLRASQVRLDPKNPRLPEGTDNDHEAINRLLDEGYTSLLALARDLVETGESNPAELPIVMKDGSKYLVLEGNRRFAALKLLANPSLADDPKQRAAFKRIADKGEAPKTVMCAVDTSRESADHWLVLRHTGMNKGVGVRTWNAEQVAIHRRRANATIDSGTARAITIADELQEAYAQDETLVATIKRVRNDKLTNIGRFFATEVMHRLHLAVRDTKDLYVREQTLWAKHSTDDLHDFFVWAMEYIDDNSVDAYKNAGIRSRLLDGQSDLLPDTTDLDDVEEERLADVPWVPGSDDDDADDDDLDDDADDDVDDLDDDLDGDDEEETDEGSDDGDGGTGTGSGTGTGTGKGKRKNEAKPEKRLFQDLKLGHLTRRTQFLLKEARQIEHDVSPGIACVMARTIVELAVSEPNVLAWSGATEKDFLKEKIVACLAALDPKYDKSRPNLPALNPAYLETQQDFGIRYLHQFVHNPAAYPDSGVSRRFSHHWRPLLEAINERTGEETA